MGPASLLWETSEYRALMHLPHVFVVHLHKCQFGSLSGRASRVTLDMSILSIVATANKVPFRSWMLHVLWSVPCAS